MATTAAFNTEINQDVWRATMSSVLPFLSKPFGSSYSAQQSTVLGVSAAIPTIRSTYWPPRFLEIVDASING
jgi:enterochelin esterase-like enzyme